MRLLLDYFETLGVISVPFLLFFFAVCLYRGWWQVVSEERDEADRRDP
jgi:hypothetical protein